MTDTAVWYGESGRAYTYEVHDLSWQPAPGAVGNFVFARMRKRAWHAVLVGQGALGQCKEQHLRRGDVTRKGAMHFHEHLNADAISRLSEEDDVLHGNPEAYAPSGCNELA